MSGIGAALRSGSGRRWWQTAILSLTTVVSVAAAVLGLGLLVASDAPFDDAFAAQRGAHLQMDLDGSVATDRALAATAAVAGVTDSAGPFPMITAQVRADGPDSDTVLGLLTIVGRADPSAAVDTVPLQAGRWALGPGEIVLDTRELSMSIGAGFIGTKVLVDAPSGSVSLTVVGTARSVTHTADGWVSPHLVSTLSGAALPDRQMLYRFDAAGTAAQLSAGRDSIAAALPPDAVLGAVSYLSVRQSLSANAAAFAPFVTVFGVIALVMALLVVGIVVSGSVAAAGRRIGILKAIGCTPWQVAGSYLARLLIPVAAGVLLGAAVGTAVAAPVLSEMEHTYGTADLGIPGWVIGTVAGAALLLVALAATVPALHIAGRPAAQVLRGRRRTSGISRGRPVQRSLAAAPLPRSVTLGLAAPFRRPARNAAMAATVLAGSVCLTFAIGLMSSLNAVQHDRDPLSGAAVQVGAQIPFEPANGGPTDPLPARTSLMTDPAAVSGAIAAQPGTGSVCSVSEVQLDASGLPGAATVAALAGDCSFTAHRMIAGRWLSGAAGEIVVPTAAMRASGARIGEQMTLSIHGRSARVTVVGEVFDLTRGGERLYADASVLGALRLDPGTDTFLVDARPGTDIDAYLGALDAAVAPLGAEARAGDDGSSSVLLTMNAVAALLAAMLVVVAGIGVLNATILQTREGVRDLGVFKALGMTPGQVVAMVLSSTCCLGLLAGAVGVPLGVVLHHAIVPAMGGAAGAVLAPAQLAVYTAPIVALLLTGGLVIAAAGAIGPAGWAARASSATALRTE